MTVIATVLNDAAELPLLLQSLRSQTASPAEIVIVDGGSVDGTWELLSRAAEVLPQLTAIQDPSCSLRNSPGPIARGRNIAIRRATQQIIACADAGCSYEPDWLAEITRPIFSGQADVVAGGSCTQPGAETLWDVAAAPFLGFNLGGKGSIRTDSGTARSLAFRREVWEQVGGFPEHSLLAEDTLFTLKAQHVGRYEFVTAAPAYYRPRFGFIAAAKRLWNYAAADGAQRLRTMRLARMLLRILAAPIALASISFFPVLFIAWFAAELWFAFRLDLPALLATRFGWKALPPRLAFSLLVPWIFVLAYLSGAVSQRNQVNAQNQSARAATGEG